MVPRTGASVAAGLLGLALVAFAAIFAARSLLREAGGASLTSRLAEGRLYGQAHRPFVPPEPGDADAEDEPPSGTFRGTAGLRRAGLRGTGAETHAARGRVALGNGFPRRAVRDLEQAVAQAPAEVAYRNDLAVAYLSLGDADRPVAFLTALGVLERALNLAPHDPVLLYNQAVALEKSHLVRSAAEAWNGVAAGETDPEWRAEAREHLGRIEAPTLRERWQEHVPFLDEALEAQDLAAAREIVGRFPHRSELHAVALLDRWTEEAARRHPQQAPAALSQLRTLAAILEQDHGLPEAAHTVAAYDRLQDHPSRRGWIEAYRLYAQGRDLCQRDRGAEGAELLDRAAGSADLLGEPLRYRVIYYQARCAYTGSEYRTVISVLGRLVETPGIDRYKGLAARSWWLLGLSRLARVEPSEALAAYLRAASLLDEAGSSEAAALGAPRAEVYSHLGQEAEAGRVLDRALEWAVLDGSPRGLYRALDELADAAVRAGELEAARLVREEVLVLALDDPDDSPGIAHAYLRRAEASIALGDLEEAFEDLENARSWCDRIEDEGERRRRTADLLLAEGRLLAEEDPAGALDPLDRALELYHDTDARFFLAEVRLDRAAVHRSLGDLEAAGMDLRMAASDFESQRLQLPVTDLRRTYFSRAGEIFAALIDLEAAQPGGEERAFHGAERSRARVLADLIAGREEAPAGAVGSGQEPRTVEEILRLLPEGVAVVEYAVLPDRTLAWVLRADTGITMVELRVGGAELARRVQRLRTTLRPFRYDEEGYAAQAPELYELVIGPLLPALEGVETLVLIPDKALHSLPFQALIDPDSGEPLLQSWLVTTALSAALYAADLDRGSLQPDPGRLSGLILAYGEGREDLDLEELRQAEREGAAVAARYGDRAELLAGPQATAEAFLDRAPGYDVVHFTVHAQVNRNHPHLSRMFLAPGTTRADGSLYAYEIQDLDLGGLYLAVLAGCETGAGPAVSTEGVMSHARAFLAAGVPRVVASLWVVDDELAPVFFETFHGHLLAGQTPAEALRSTQLDMLRNPDPHLRVPSFWAGFQVVGGI